MIKLIDNTHIPLVADLAGECFIDDPFYLHLSAEREKRMQLIRDIFAESIRICVDHGYAYMRMEGEMVVSFALWFNYGKLKSEYPDDFNFIFKGSEVAQNIKTSLSDEFYKIDNYLKGNREYLYLLAIGVRKEYQRKGYATQMVRIVQDCFPNYNLFSDISNKDSVALYLKLGFRVVGEYEHCSFVRYLSEQDTLPVISAQNKIWLAVPSGLSLKKMDINATKRDTIKLEYVKDEGGYFSPSPVGGDKADLYYLSYKDLIKYQRYINVQFFQEIKLQEENRTIVYYTSVEPFFPGFRNYEEFLANYDAHHKEWSIIPDVYISIPIQYNDRKRFAGVIERTFVSNRVLEALNFRTTYEAGIPVKNIDDKMFKYRIERFYLGRVSVQIQEEKQLSFNGLAGESQPCGDAISVDLILSIDKETRMGVLHLVSLSCGLLITQLLDSTSRNQINVLNKGESLNFYKYLETEFGIEKKGSAKSFLTIPQNRKEVPQDFLASVLFAETLYEEGEVLGKVVDKDIWKLLSSPYGIAQYDYATVYTFKNVVVQMSQSFQGDMASRLAMESVTLFYIELILFEEAAIEIANEEIVKFLVNINQYTHRNVLKSVNQILTTHVKSIEFWDIQVNYPSSVASINNIRNAFGIGKLRAAFQRNKEEILTIYNMRSDIVDKAEANFIALIGSIFTIVSVINFILEPKNHLVFISFGLFVLVLLFLYKRYLVKFLYAREGFWKRYIKRYFRKH